MTTELKIWQNKIKEKRKQTDFRNFLKDIASWKQLVLYKNNGMISGYPVSDRTGGIIKFEDFEEYRETLINNNQYDFSKDIFSNWKLLLKSIKLSNLIQIGQNENTSYSEICLSSKNVYLSFNIINDCENIFYSSEIKDNCKNIYNCVMIWDNCENIYMSLGVFRSFNIFYCKNIQDCSNVWFSSDLIGCQECLFCSKLQNKKYHINNKEYSKDEYHKQKEIILSDKESFLQNYENIDFDGDILIECENITNGNFNYRVENGRNMLFAGTKDGNKNFFDVVDVGSPSGNDYYAVMGAGPGDNIYNSVSIMGSNIYYSYFLINCDHCLGCIGLKNKSYCILNKQYKKEERYELVDKIFTQMEQQGILGKMLPGEANPFYFNDTLAYLIDNSFTKDEITSQGYMRRDEPIKVDIPGGMEIIESKNLDIVNYDENILKKVIRDDQGNVYRIVKMEYDFLKKYNLPLPNIHWLDRIKLHFKDISI